MSSATTTRPTNTRWLNMVERFFGDITVNAIRRGTFTSVSDLIESMDVYLLDHDENPRPFVWIANPRNILAKVMRAQQTLRTRPASPDVAGC